MGDRGNIVVRQSAGTNKSDVWFYGHWNGYRLEESVRESLARKARWNDPSYLARIIFNDFQKDDRWETGFGISTVLQDNEYPIVIVDIPAQVVRTIDESGLDDLRLPDDISKLPGVPFAEFIKSPQPA